MNNTSEMHIDELKEDPEFSRIQQDCQSLAKAYMYHSHLSQASVVPMTKAHCPQNNNFHEQFLKFGIWPELSFDQLASLKREYKIGKLDMRSGSCSQSELRPGSVLLPSIMHRKASAMDWHTMSNSRVQATATSRQNSVDGLKLHYAKLERSRSPNLILKDTLNKYMRHFQRSESST